MNSFNQKNNKRILEDYGIAYIFLISFICFLTLHLAWWVFSDDPSYIASFPISYKAIAIVSTISIQFILISGAGLRLYLEYKDPNRENRNLIYKNIFWPSLGVAILHEITNFNGLGAYAIFEWSQFHTVFVALSLLIWAYYANSKLPYVLFFLSLAVRYFLYNKLFLNSMPLAPIVSGHNTSLQNAGIILTLTLSLALIYVFYKKVRFISPIRRIFIYLLTQSLLLWASIEFYNWKPRVPTELFTTDNYLNVILTGDIRGYNMYPLLPWLPVVISGFLIIDILKRFPMHLHIILKTYLAIGFIGIIYIFNFYSGKFYLPQDGLVRNLFRGSNDELGIGIYVETAWFLIFLPLAYFIRKKFNLVFIEKTSKKIGQGMIIIYYSTIFTGEDLAHYLNNYNPRFVTFTCLFIIYFIIGIVLSNIINYIFSKKIELTLIKKHNQ